MRYFLELSYLGTNYHGWQRQTNAPTVQEEIEKALSVLLQTQTEVTGCGRTDAGVHAKKYFLHFDADNALEEEKLVYKLNGILAKDISIHQAIQVSEDAHTRFGATSRSYEYHIHQFKNPFLEGLSTDYRQPLNVELMNEAAHVLLQTKEFGAFCKAGADNHTDFCDVREAIWKKTNDQLIFCITADRFLRNMVRAIVGTLLDVGLRKITVDEFKQIVNSQDRRKAGVSVPAHGLYLTDIKYPFI